MIDLTHKELESLGFYHAVHMLAPSSPYGWELVRKPHFFGPVEREALETEWENIEKGMSALRERVDAVERLCHCFSQLRDIRPTLLRIQTETLDEIELFEVKRYLLQLTLIAPLYRQTGADFLGIVITEETEALSILDPDGMRLPAYSIHARAGSPLYEARNRKAALETALRENTGEEARRHLMEERRRWVLQEEEEARRERRRLTEALRPFSAALLRNAEKIGRVDFLLAKARLAAECGCVKPIMIKKGVRFFEMVNPKIDDLMREAKGPADGSLAGGSRESNGPAGSSPRSGSAGDPGAGRFAPLTIEAPEGATVVTGANMGGKSVAIRTLALNVLLCHAGFFAFAKHAELSLFDSMHLIIADYTDEERGVSSFAAEILKISRLLSDIENGSYCFSIIDEPARGTNPEEGAALVKALVKKMSGRRSVCLVTTHFDGVAGAATARYHTAGFYNLPDRMPEGAGVSWIAKHMRYGLIPDDGTPPPRHALTVCRLLGLDREVVDEMERALFAEGSRV